MAGRPGARAKSRKPKQPERVRVGGEFYRATVMRIDQADELGRPILLRVVRDDETISVRQGDHFIIAYVKE